MSQSKLSPVEGIKSRSRYLRGTIAECLDDPSTGSISADDQQLIKFHGMYQQDDRDLRANRRQHKLEKAFSFMLRVRMPGGVVTPEQWLKIDQLSDDYGNSDFKLTTRQAFQLHGLIKSNLRNTIQGIDKVALDSIAACGDVNRNVMCNPNPHLSQIHAEVIHDAGAISNHLTPKSRAYHEIWLEGEKIHSSQEEHEPIYGETYLPRKFKIAIAVPPSNDVDIFANDLAFIAVVDEENELIGYNVAVGGGMGMTHGVAETYPRLADVIGYIPRERLLETAEHVVTVQRDFGDRENRKHARLKYTIDTHGLKWFVQELESRLSAPLEAAMPYQFDDNGDRYGWTQGGDGHWHYTQFVEGGRVVDRPNYMLRSALREVAKLGCGDFRLTANQNVVIARVDEQAKAQIDEIFASYGLTESNHQSGLRLAALACVALPTCGLALAEAERFLPKLVDDIEQVTEAAGLRHDAITIRMTGCPNGCARPYIAEIGFVGKGPDRYNLYLGGGHAGQRLNRLYQEDVKASEIVGILEPIIQRYAREREDGEKFGDFVIRAGIIEASGPGAEFQKAVPVVTA